MDEKMKKEKERIIILSIASNTLLVLIKLIIGLASGLVSIVAEALHSANDLLASIIAYFGVKKSLEPPDEDHQYGHGKWEVITGTIENILILLIAVYIVYEGVDKLLHKTEPKNVEFGIVVMIISGVVNIFISRYLIRKGREMRSIGIEVDGEHLRADVITSIGVAVALILLKLTNWSWLDPAAALFVGIWVLFIFFELMGKLIRQMTDTSLAKEELVKIEEIVKSIPEIKFYHKIRTRQSGSTIFVDMHIKVDPALSVARGHDITRDIESRLRDLFKDVNVLVHVEPFK